MKKRLENFIKKFKEANFEQAIIVLVGVFLLGIFLYSLTVNNTTTTVKNSTGSSTNNTGITTTVDPTQITYTQKNLYSYNYGVVEVTGTNGIYYYQYTPTNDDLVKIKKELNLVSLELVDETYKAIKKTEPLEPEFPEQQILDAPRPSDNLDIQEGMDGTGVVD